MRTGTAQWLARRGNAADGPEAGVITSREAAGRSCGWRPAACVAGLLSGSPLPQGDTDSQGLCLTKPLKLRRMCGVAVGVRYVGRSCGLPARS